jgi:hypothetical protein
LRRVPAIPLLSCRTLWKRRSATRIPKVARGINIGTAFDKDFDIVNSPSYCSRVQKGIAGRAPLIGIGQFRCQKFGTSTISFHQLRKFLIHGSVLNSLGLKAKS